MTAGALLVAGTQSDAGKSVIVAGLCRWLHRRGVRVAPFKAQNMALNSVVTPDGAEIGRAQAAQAAAAGLRPEVEMNPVLLKPSGDRRSQIVLMGRPWGEATAASYGEQRRALREPVMAALADLRSRYDAVICEGAGSPAEINLRADDLANMGLARAAVPPLPVLVAADIDRGGIFAGLYGTTALLEPADQALICGHLVNKFRGDPAILAPGLERLAALTGRPTLGVIPFAHDLGLDGEDSLALQAGPPGPTAPVGEATLEVAVVRLRWTSNFTDVDALAAEPGVAVRFTRSPSEIARADLVVVPGTKATVEDLERLRAEGLDRALAERAAAGDPILGICGGYQLLGETIDDGVESGRGRVDGLGLLPITTRFHAEKLLRHRAGLTAVLAGAGDPADAAPAPGRPGTDGPADRPRGDPANVVARAPASIPDDVPAAGYEIRHGRVHRHGGRPLLRVTGEGPDADGRPGARTAPLPAVDGEPAHEQGEGCLRGAVAGTSLHGVLEGDELRRALLTWVAARRVRAWRPGSRTFADVREARLDALGDLIEEHVDGDAVLRLLADGPPAGLPVLAPGGAS